MSASLPGSNTLSPREIATPSRIEDSIFDSIFMFVGLVARPFVRSRPLSQSLSDTHDLNDLVVDVQVVKRRQDKMMTEAGTTTMTMLEFMERMEAKVDRMEEKVDQIEGKVDGIRSRPSRASM